MYNFCFLGRSLLFVDPSISWHERFRTQDWPEQYPVSCTDVKYAQWHDSFRAF